MGNWPVTLRRTASFTSGGFTLFRQTWLPAGEPRGSVVIVHGIHEHSGRYGRAAQKLATAQFAVHAYDLRGHGRSEGIRATVRSLNEHVHDLDRLVAAVGREHRAGLPTFLLGHSLGGCIVATYLTHRRKPPVAGAVLSAPALKRLRPLERLGAAGLGLFARFAPATGVVRITPEGISRDPAVVAAYEADPLIQHRRVSAATAAAIARAMQAAHRHAGRVHVPLLVLHGTSDPITPPGGSAWFCEHCGSIDRTFRLLPGLRHELLNEPEQDDVLGILIEWLAARSS